MYHCPHCPRSFETSGGLNGHQRSHSQGAPSSNLKSFECMGCGKSVVDYQSRSRRYCSNACQAAHRWHSATLPSALLGNEHRLSVHIKLVADRDGYACATCGLSSWLDKPLTLDLDHIDGNPKNFAPQNLRLLCPNCHRQTETWGNSKLKSQLKNGRRRLAKSIVCVVP